MAEDSYLPAIIGVFYTVFDNKLGPIVKYQVPSNIVSSPDQQLSGRSGGGGGTVATATSGGTTSSVNLESSRSPAPSSISVSVQPVRSISRSRLGPGAEKERQRSRSRSRERSNRDRSPSGSFPQQPLASSLFLPSLSSSKQQELSSQLSLQNQPLIDFNSISQYVIPQKPFCGRLVSILAGEGGGYRCVGWPVCIEDQKYERNDFRFNIVFVFPAQSTQQTHFFTPLVKKTNRLLRAFEVDSSYLSSPNTSHKVLNVIEQLFEDLNTYEETSIPVLDFGNALDLRVGSGWLDNPPAVEDWHVPISLVDLSPKAHEENWDLTMLRISPFIDGVRHVKLIAELADCDLHMTRLCIQHLLYYQVVIITDIFQHSNIYTLKPSIQYLAEDPSVASECAAYVLSSLSYDPPSWPQLLRLYTKLNPNTSVKEWQRANPSIAAMGIDVRRFISFGIIKGFLRRVHRWPVRAELALTPPMGTMHDSRSSTNANSARGAHYKSWDRPGVTIGSENDSGFQSESGIDPNQSNITANDSGFSNIGAPDYIQDLPAQYYHQHQQTMPSRAGNDSTSMSRSPGDSQFSHHYTNSRKQHLYPTASVTSLNNTSPKDTKSLIAPNTVSSRLKKTREQVVVGHPVDLLPLLDGNHNTDELSVRFGVGWAKLENWFRSIGGVMQGEEQRIPGDYGSVKVVLR